MTDAADYRQHAEKIRRLVAGVRGNAASAALMLAEEYEARAAQLEGKPAAAVYVGDIDRIGQLVAAERDEVRGLAAREAELIAQLDQTRQQRAIAEARVDAILKTARLLDMPDQVRRGAAHGAAGESNDAHAAPLAAE